MAQWPSTTLVFCLLPVAVLAASSTNPAVLVDRGLPTSGSAGSPSVNSRLGWSAAGIFVTDHFTIGLPGELWVIDKVRIWAVPGLQSEKPGAIGDLFERVTLYGGLESETPPSTPAQAAAECACHGPIPIAATALRPGSSVSQDPHVVLAPTRYGDGGPYREEGRSLGIWQVDFQDLRWSVPGGVNVQFGIFGAGRQNSGSTGQQVWFSHTSRTSGEHQFRLFETGGSPVVPSSGMLPQDKSIGINVQVWGHLTARVTVRHSGKTWRVALLGGPGIDALQIKLESIHFGPNGATPIGSIVEDTDGDGRADLVLTISDTGSGIQPSQSTACLTGLRLDNIPFEGCGILTGR